MDKTIEWLWSMYRLRKLYRAPDVLFSQRTALLQSVRPLVGMEFSSSDVVDWPDAIFAIKPEDVTRAELNLEVLRRHPALFSST